MTPEPVRGEPSPRRVLEVTDEASGLEAWIAVDSVEEGLTAGGIRRARYESREAAIAEAKRLARAMTLKCRAAELPSGGAKTVIRDRADLDVPAAYRALARQIDRLDPPYLCGPDLGTGPDELAPVREVTDRVNPEANDPGRATAVGVLSGIQAVLWALDGDPTVEGGTFLVQGYGSVGSYVAQGLTDQGGKVLVAETDPGARERAEDAGLTTIDPEAWASRDVDVLVPCAGGDAVTAGIAERLAARGICGSANGPLASRKAAEVLHERNVQYAPDVVVNAGAVVEGVLTWREGGSPRVQDEIDRRLSAVYDRARSVLEAAASEDRPPDRVVLDRWGPD